jgi:hypothetical protein
MGITHAKVSTAQEGADPSKVRTSDWNAAHVVELTTADIEGLDAALALKAASNHNHDATYAAASHGHAQSEVTNLVSDLAAKVPTARTISTAAPLSGGGDLSANRTLTIAQFGSGASGIVPASGGGTSNFLRADGTWTAPAGGSSPAGVLSDLQVSLLQAPFTLAAASGVQSAFPAAQDTFTLAANSTYRITGRYLIATGTTTHTTALAWAGAASITSLEYLTTLWSAAANAIATAGSFCHVSGAAVKVINATSTAVRTVIEFDGTLVTSSGGSLVPQVSFSANPTGTNQMLRGSYVVLERLGSDVATIFGAWA